MKTTNFSFQNNNNGQQNHPRTPGNCRRVSGLFTLSSSSNKKKVFYKSNLGKQRKELNQSFSIELDPGYVSRSTWAKFAINVVQYLLYDSHAMVLPFQNFQRFYAVKSQTEFGENENLDQDSNSKPSENMISKVNRLNVRNEIDLYEMYHSLDQLFTSVSSLMATDIRISELALCIGDSVHFAKEIFTLNMNDLNIIDHRLDTEERNLKNSKLPTLSVRYLIQTFYKKLLNNIIPELEKQFGGASSKSKNCPDKNNVILAVKINQSQLVQFQTELDRLQQTIVLDNVSSIRKQASETFNVSDYESKYRLNTTSCFMRLGSAMTKRTTFTFHYTHDEYSKSGVAREPFQVYCDDIDPLVQENEKCLPEEEIFEEYYADVSSSSSSAVSSSEDTLEFKDEEESKYDLGTTPVNKDDDHQDESTIWVQIGLPIVCHSKMGETIRI